MILAYVLAQQCGDTHVESSYALNSSTQFLQTCSETNSKCVQFKYVDLPEQYKNVFQLVDPSDQRQYNLCAQYTSEQNCQRYCTKQCQKVSVSSQPMKFNLSMSARHGKTIHTQNYVNETAFSNYSYVCANMVGVNLNNKQFVIIMLLSCCMFAFIVYSEWYISQKYKQTRKQKYFSIQESENQPQI
ncbi:Hypothetical_protein [Hexamita inflata]|uniref:Hypothetical_protein n=1 Tax=Hexamita inflata TaxID=28002 RepID=A0AA86U922_9EUKA|nr:Hypothetical protein HINF_LOCUS2791 [Hexamita inflata]CAI9933973.1 Hypothetical protein HINF_LOCUS21618 [Hexamita inflata]